MCHVSVTTRAWARAVCVCVYHTWLQKGAPAERRASRTNCAPVFVTAPLMWWKNRFPQRWSKYTRCSNCTNKSSEFSHGLLSRAEVATTSWCVRSCECYFKAGHYWDCFAVSRYSGTSPRDYKFLLHLTFPFQSHICLHATAWRAYTSQMP